MLTTYVKIFLKKGLVITLQKLQCDVAKMYYQIFMKCDSKILMQDDLKPKQNFY